MPGGSHENMRAWDPEEDQRIIELLEELGPKWSKIVQALPGRSVSSVRNRWQRIEKGRRLRMNGQESKNRCQQCGEPKRGHVCLARLKNRGESGEMAEEAAAVWAEHSRPGISPAVSRQSSFSGVQPATSRQPSWSAAAVPPRVASDDPEVAPEGATMPLLASMKSGTRICNELGFEALALAASQLAQREREFSIAGGEALPDQVVLARLSAEDIHSVEDIVEDDAAAAACSVDRAGAAELPHIGRLPSYASLHLHAGSVLSGGSDGEAAALCDLSSQPMTTGISGAPAVAASSAAVAPIAPRDQCMSATQGAVKETTTDRAGAMDTFATLIQSRGNSRGGGTEAKSTRAERSTAMAAGPTPEEGRTVGLGVATHVEAWSSATSSLDSNCGAHSRSSGPQREHS